MMAEIETLPVDNATDDLTGELPVMPLRNLMIFPSIVMPVSVGRQPTLKLVNQAFQSKEPIIITTQKVSEVDSPKQKDLFPIAVIGKVPPGVRNAGRNHYGHPSGYGSEGTTGRNHFYPPLPEG